jgi:hypothetical protein
VTPYDDLWRLKQITGKSEFELFYIAAEEKGWPDYQVEKHFRRFLNDQTLPVYVKEFLEDGKQHIGHTDAAVEIFLAKSCYDKNYFGAGLDKTAFEK